MIATAAATATTMAAPMAHQGAVWRHRYGAGERASTAMATAGTIAISTATAGSTMPATSEDGGYLRVGQRISGNFGDMPAQYRDRYRDSDGSYYRYDRGNIYQVDARTNLILRIFADGR